MPIVTIGRWKRRLRRTKQGVTGSLARQFQRSGRRPIEEIDADIVPALEQMLVDETAGDPMGHYTWRRCSCESLSRRLTAQGHLVSAKTVRRLLRKRGYSLRAIKKRQAGGSCPDSNEQFQYIRDLKAHFVEQGLPVISIDAKKKELIGNYYKPGKTWRKTPIEADVFFPSSRQCLAVPFGIYDVSRNAGYVTVGISANTSQFAINCLTSWWRLHGQTEYPKADRLLILADGGSNNSPKLKAWKMDLQDHISDAFGLTITVSHYPPGCSKWNPIEHRLFGQISRNWAGRPLRNLQEMLAFIRGTTTTTGLKVEAELDQQVYLTGRKVTKQEFSSLALVKHDVCPDWNYTLSPRTASRVANCDEAKQATVPKSTRKQKRGSVVDLAAP